MRHCAFIFAMLALLAGVQGKAGDGTCLYPAAGDLVNVPEVCINAARQEILDQWCDTNIIPAAGDPVGSGICRQCTVCPTGQYPTTPCRTANAVFTVDGFADTICGPCPTTGTIPPACSTVPTTCGVGCATCNAGVCSACQAGNFLAGNACTPCSANCAACTSATVCTQCATGYVPSGTGCQLLVCPANCATCTGGQCSLCNSGFVLAGNTCTPQACDANCAVACVGGLCGTCKTGYTRTVAGTCQANVCPAKCAVGACPLATKRCSRCSAGYKLDTVANTCTAFVLPTNCVTMNSLTGACTTCATGYTVSAGACVKIICPSGCNVCTSTTRCTPAGCATGFTYKPVTSTCAANPTPGTAGPPPPKGPPPPIAKGRRML